MWLSLRISVPDNFDQSNNYTSFEAIKLEKRQPDIKDPCQGKF